MTKAVAFEGRGRRYGSALAGQSLLSGFHFAVHALLLRHLEPSDYAVFALAFVLASFGGTLSNALAATPLSVYTPGLTRSAPRVVLETLFASVNIILVLVLLFAGVAIALLLSHDLAVIFGFAVFVSAWTLRHFSRSFAFARRQPDVALRTDVGYVVVASALVAVGWMSGYGDLLVVALTAMSFAHCVAALRGFQVLDLGLLPRLRPRLLRRYTAIWQQTRWSLVGVVAITLQRQSHSIIVTALAGPAAYAPLAAGQLLFRPLGVAIQSWQMVMRPELALAIAQQDRHSVKRSLGLAMAFLGGGTLMFGAAIFVFWTPIVDLIYAKQYSQYPMGWIVTFSALATVLLALRTPTSALLQAFKEFRTLAMITMVGAAISVVGVTSLLLAWSPAASLLGIVLAELVVFGLVWHHVVSRLRRVW